MNGQTAPDYPPLRCGLFLTRAGRYGGFEGEVKHDCTDACPAHIKSSCDAGSSILLIPKAGYFLYIPNATTKLLKPCPSGKYKSTLDMAACNSCPGTDIIPPLWSPCCSCTALPPTYRGEIHQQKKQLSMYWMPCWLLLTECFCFVHWLPDWPICNNVRINRYFCMYRVCNRAVYKCYWAGQMPNVPGRLHHRYWPSRRRYGV